MAFKKENLCQWLGLDPRCWPPEPHALLGLPPGETNLALIEQKVQERICRLRCYQLSHPDDATEGMNRLAQAFIQLSEKAAQAPPARGDDIVREPLPARVADDTAIDHRTKLDWHDAPPPVRAEPERPEIPVGILDTSFVSAQRLAASEREMILGLAERSPEARKGLRTLHDLLRRSRQTRHLLVAWVRVGRYLASPKRRLTRSAEKKDFQRRLDDLVERIESYPAFVGYPGLPGYRVVALAHLVLTPEMYNSMDLVQRELLAEDWTLASRVLFAHRSYLCRQFKSLRRQGRFALWSHALQAAYAEHPALWTTAAGLLVAAALGSLATLLVVG
jgi:hypothetical protein